MDPHDQPQPESIESLDPAAWAAFSQLLASQQPRLDQQQLVWDVLAQVRRRAARRRRRWQFGGLAAAAVLIVAVGLSRVALRRGAVDAPPIEVAAAPTGAVPTDAVPTDTAPTGTVPTGLALEEEGDLASLAWTDEVDEEVSLLKAQASNLERSWRQSPDGFDDLRSRLDEIEQALDESEL